MSERPTISAREARELANKRIQQEKLDGTYYIKCRDMFRESTLLTNSETPWLQEKDGEYYLYNCHNTLVANTTEKDIIKLLVETVEELRRREKGREICHRTYEL